MKSPRWSSSCIVALLLVPSFASAGEPSLADWAQARVQEGLVKPLAERAVARFSRARPVAREYWVRVLQPTAARDRQGHDFMPFSVDSRLAGGEWQADDIVGCAYLGKGDLFVKRGDGYRPVAFLLGKNVDPAPGVCEAAPPTKSS